MKKFFALIGLMIFLNPATVFAGDGLYVKAGAGFVIMQNADVESEFHGSNGEIGFRSFETGFNLHAAIGKKFTTGFAVELEYGYNEADRDEKEVLGVVSKSYGEASIKTLMINGLFNLENSTPFTPYAGVGFGIGFVELSNEQSHANNPHELTDSNFAFQLMLGAEYALTDKIALTSGYRYLNGGEVTQQYLDDAKVSLDLDSHNFESAIKYSF